MKKLALCVFLLVTFIFTANAQENQKRTKQMEHYTFTLSDQVTRQTVSFKNRFGITLVGDLYLPKNLDKTKKNPAIAISGPFGAVKEQSSGFYANQLAALGFITLAFDPSFTGQSGGEPRYTNSPDINTEDFSAAVDYLVTRDFVDVERIGILGICGWGGLAINVAAVDTRIKATVVSTMYDISRVTRKGYFDAKDTKADRMEMRKALSMQRSKGFLSNKAELGGGVIDPLPADAPEFVKDYYAYYKTKRGYHERSLNSNGGWNKTAAISYLNANLLTYASEIDSAVMILHGEKAHSRYMGETAFKLLKGDNKELVIVPNASHCDLYDTDKIPFDKIQSFFVQNLK